MNSQQGEDDGQKDYLCGNIPPGHFGHFDGNGNITSGDRASLLQAGFFTRCDRADRINSLQIGDAVERLNDYVEVFADAQGDWRWRRKAANHEVVSTSGEGYIHKSYAEEAARAFNAEVADFRTLEDSE